MVIVSPRRAISAAASAGVSGATLPLAAVQPGVLWLFRGDAVGEGAALARRVVGCWLSFSVISTTNIPSNIRLLGP